MIKPIIAIRDATKAYKGRVVVDVDRFDLLAGDRVQIIGRNGSGKSTLLRLLAGISQPTTGQVWRDGSVVAGGIGYIPQTGGLYDDLNLLDNAALINAAINCSHSHQEDLNTLLREFSLDAYAQHAVGSLSGGIKRLCTLLSVWVTQPALLIADEPFAGVDPENAARLEALMLTRSDQYALVFSSHASRDIGRAIYIENGSIEREDLA